MTCEELSGIWTARRDAFARAGALVDGAKIVDEFLTDLLNVEQTDRGCMLTLGEAARRCGYSAEHLGRLVREGRMPEDATLPGFASKICQPGASLREIARALTM